jgi:hypothetical protein
MNCGLLLQYGIKDQTKCCLHLSYTIFPSSFDHISIACISNYVSCEEFYGHNPTSRATYTQKYYIYFFTKNFAHVLLQVIYPRPKDNFALNKIFAFGDFPKLISTSK